ncbi:hypothetical protein [Thermosipho sp. (in: thermotogales)]|jgi:hypothetical protein|uniref:hypothetical protein n=1 Tax=Thermosipho sp. (in: thermotogales) TaxID=1968895 RepID=UPI00257CF8DD|nr:hypothetical protein [Thermosipho sp. (in: thermotogales)]MBZ4649175.1 hypothetical protein [Thermosipho sp. (in: thermotogales)]
MALNKSRYSWCVVIKENDIYYIGGTDPLKIRKSDDDIEHIWSQGDRLDLLAKKYLNDDKLWWIIAEYNNIMFFFEEIEIGRIIYIPSLYRVVTEIL